MEIVSIPIDEIAAGTQRRSTGDLGWLRESIRENGLMSPISVTTDGRLISGWHRLEACKALGHTHIPARIVRCDDLHIAMAAIDENLVRKELSALGRAEHLAERKLLFEAIHPDTRRGGDRGNQYSGGRRRQTAISAFCQQATVWSGYSRRSVNSYVQVARKLTPETRHRIRGSVLAYSITLLAALSRIPEAVQLRTAECFLRERCKSIREASEVLQREMRFEGASPSPLPVSHRFIDGDFREISDQIEDGTVSLLLTDPPYTKDSLNLFDPLGAFAAKKLKDGGSMFCMIGAYHLPEIIAALNRHLRWQWCYAFTLKGAGKLVYSRRVCNAHKLILWFVKGKYSGAPFTDLIDGIGKDKRFHVWGQSENGFDLLIERYSAPGDIVLDPFLGGGTVGAAALSLGRNFIGIEIDPDHMEMAKRRLSVALP